MLVFGLVIYAIANLLPGMKINENLKAIRILVFCSVVFGFELALLLLSYGICMRPIVLKKAAFSGFCALIPSIMLVLAIDSFFWQILLWPELESFSFNVFNARSSEWVVSPWYEYFSHHMPKLMMNPLSILLFFWELTSNFKKTIQIIIPSLIYLGVYSFNGHKEWRFIIYVLPMFLAVSACGAANVLNQFKSNTIKKIWKFILYFSCLGTLVLTFIIVWISSQNYPGEKALTRLHEINNSTKAVVYLDTYVCMTGATLFLSNRQNWEYIKTDNISNINWEIIDYALVAFN